MSKSLPGRELRTRGPAVTRQLGMLTQQQVVLMSAANLGGKFGVQRATARIRERKRSGTGRGGPASFAKGRGLLPVGDKRCSLVLNSSWRDGRHT